jgi:hypothetical protein
LGTPGLVLGTALSYAFGKSLGRAVAVALLGVVVVGLVFAWAYVSTSPDEDCHECAEVLGRSMSPIFAFGFLPANLVTWWIGTVLGAYLRRSQMGSAPPASRDR